MNNSTFGKAGEDACERLLEKKRWVIVARNYRVASGELDIVAYKRGVLAFVEVKTRSGDKFGAPADAVNDIKRKRLKDAAGGFYYEQIRFGKIPVWSKLFRVQRMKRVKRYRFDIAEVFMQRDGTLLGVNYIENAFE